MDYTLAKELKDAGFPMRGPIEMVTKRPSLEELIEAMPMRIKEHPQLINSGFFMLAKLCGSTPSYHAYFEGESNEGVLDGLSFKDKDPKVSVARLWLAFNKKV